MAFLPIPNHIPISWLQVTDQPPNTRTCGTCHAMVMYSEQYQHQQWHNDVIGSINNAALGDQADINHLRTQVQTQLVSIQGLESAVERSIKAGARPARKKRGTPPEGHTDDGGPMGMTV